MNVSFKWRTSILFLVMTTLMVCGSDTVSNTAPVRHVILIIGDGMGLTSIDTVSLLTKGQKGALNMESMPYIGLLKTFSHDQLVPDSAASGTAMATGFKTNNASVSIDPDQKKLKTILEHAKEQGWKTGVLTTSYLVDATPAVFTTHETQRKNRIPIANQMLDLKPDLLIGGDWGLFDADTESSRALRDRMHQLQQSGAYRIIRDPKDLAQNPATPLMCLFPHRGENIGAGPPLEESTRFAIDTLTRDSDGFFLVIESEETDSAGHRQDMTYLKDAVLELDAAVGRALDFARQNKHTLVIVTADHVTGAPGIVAGSNDRSDVQIAWHTKGHTAQWVPLFAFGPGAETFSGVYDNTQLPKKIASLLGWQDF